jgi:hypothetical protein
MNNKNIRVVNTRNLKRLIETAEMLGFNQYPDIKRLSLDPAGFHVVELVLFDHQGLTNRDIMHHRLKVMAKVRQRHDQPLEPAEFLLDVRAEDWEAMIDAESMAKAMDEINGRQETPDGLGRRTRALFT